MNINIQNIHIKKLIYKFDVLYYNIRQTTMEGNYGFLIEKTGKKLKQTLQSVFNHLKIDLTVDQWTILSELHNLGAMSQSEIGANTFKDAPTVTRIIDILVRKDYLVRKQDTVDKRKFMITLTSHGRESVENLIPYEIGRASCRERV